MSMATSASTTQPRYPQDALPITICAWPSVLSQSVVRPRCAQLAEVDFLNKPELLVGLVHRSKQRGSRINKPGEAAAALASLQHHTLARLPRPLLACLSATAS